LLFTGVALLALAAGFGLSSWLKQPGPPEDGAAQALLLSPMPDLDKRSQTLAQYRGKVLVVNFWATWCPPCREEIPHFIEMQHKLADKGVQFVGIALDDPTQVASYVREMNINYPCANSAIPAVDSPTR
jgi:thiol-disulfide isomerase/thioredoxin